MTLARYYARAGGDRALIASVAAQLRSRWDPVGEFEAPNGRYRGADLEDGGGV